MARVTATKKFYQWNLENPDFYDDFLDDDLIDEATINLINKFFNLRTICDDDNFTVFYERQLDLVLPRYNKLIRLENTDFDAMVNEYRERQILDTNTETGTENSTKSSSTSGTETGSDSRTHTDRTVEDFEKSAEFEKSATGRDTTDIAENITKNVETSESETDTIDRTTVRTPNLTTSDSGTSSLTTNTETDTSTDGTTNVSGTNDSKAMGKQNPQSISYASSPVGEIPNMDWQYPTSQQQNTNTSESESTSTNTSESSTDTTQSGATSNTQTTTGTDTTTEDADNTKSKEGTNDETQEKSGQTVLNTLSSGEESESETSQKITDRSATDEGESSKNRTGLSSEEGAKTTARTHAGTTREQWTGRNGLTPQEALTTAMRYVRRSSAFAWLKDELEICFLSVYDI